jgi:outer membrane protein OmpA-like peptidoglycan-associated protein
MLRPAKQVPYHAAQKADWYPEPSQRGESPQVGEFSGLARLGAILMLATLLGAGGGCASPSKPTADTSSEPSPMPPVPMPPAPMPPAPAMAAPEPPPFTNRELADELRRQGVEGPAPGRKATSSPATGQTPSKTPAGGPTPEIRETPRGVVITLPHTHFAFDSYDLDPPARRVVERIAYVLNQPRAANRLVVLEGHADAIGTRTYNLSLSRRRAETVARELIEQGVQRKRITVEAFGASHPVAPNTNPDGTDNPAGRARNRRVEAIIRN